MTLKTTKSKVYAALLVVLCILAVAFTAIFALPRSIALAEEAESVFDFTIGDFIDYTGPMIDEEEGDAAEPQAPNRLWLLQVDNGAVALGDQTDYTVDGATVDGELYNSYVCYNGQAQTIILNENYILNGKTLGEYFSLENAVYVDNTATGELNKATEVTTTVRLYVDGESPDDANDFIYDEDEQAWYIQLEKVWYIVTFNNTVVTSDGNEAAIDGWTYADDVSAQTPLCPAHGDVALFEIDSAAAATADPTRFAVKYGTDVSYYDVKADEDGYVIDETKKLSDDYYVNVLAGLDAGNHTIRVTVPKYTAADGAVYNAATYSFGFMINPFSLPDNMEEDNKGITIEVVDDVVVFNGSNDNLPEVLIKFHGATLVDGKDYMLESADIDAGEASFNVVGFGNFTGTISHAGVYTIASGVNNWKSLPNIMQWTYGNYDREVNLITAEPLYDYKSNSGLWFTITTDKLGTIPASSALAEIRLDSDGYVSNSVAAALAQLNVGTYYLSATVDEHNNYRGLSARGFEFRVFRGVNAWDTTPTIKTWTEGKYTADNIPVAKTLFGTAIVTVTDSDGTIVYNSASATNTLATVKAGMYTLSAYVLGTDNYTGMDVYTVVFQVYEKPGLPWWGVLLIIIGALLVVAIVILILWKKGVFQILTNKLVVSISTKAAIDATIAAVRANQKNEEAKQHVAAEKRREARRDANKKKKEMPLEQQVAALEEKARKAAERAERMKAKSEAIQIQAERMKERAEKQAAEAAAVDSEQAQAAPSDETPATEAPKTETPAAETPVAETPTTETPVSDAQQEEQPKAEATEDSAEATKAEESAEAPAEEVAADQPAAEAAATKNTTTRRKKTPSKK